MKRVIFYVLITLLFSLVYFVTMLFANDILNQITSEMLNGNGIVVLQQIIFICLPFLIIGFNIFDKKSKFYFRILLSIATILITYFLSYLVFVIMDIKIPNLFFTYRGTPAFPLGLMSIVICVVGISFVQLVKKNLIGKIV